MFGSWFEFKLLRPCPSLPIMNCTISSKTLSSYIIIHIWYGLFFCKFSDTFDWLWWYRRYYRQKSGVTLEELKGTVREPSLVLCWLVVALVTGYVLFLGLQTPTSGLQKDELWLLKIIVVFSFLFTLLSVPPKCLRFGGDMPLFLIHCVMLYMIQD